MVWLWLCERVTEEELLLLLQGLLCAEKIERTHGETK